MSESEWAEVANLTNELIEQTDAFLKAVTEKASCPRVAVSVLACFAASSAHQAAGTALCHAVPGDETKAYEGTLDHVSKVIGMRYAESIAFAREIRATHRPGAVH